jgi:hypothetical protein
LVYSWAVDTRIQAKARQFDEKRTSMKEGDELD